MVSRRCKICIMYTDRRIDTRNFDLANNLDTTRHLSTLSTHLLKIGSLPPQRT